ncbi:hypothetical protein QBC46DRAFT_263663 [Diplogelasinospora grovesii]|uniref:Uncharacterized protein n=1 Tax=Diplogelasinospora grovesii TaxID=303347 RepID=A0AAN6N4Z4_9PEZI|nr:hypothetical protein QBC46DRAFT_263663 [Diplogelasinospora grovesii]
MADQPPADGAQSPPSTIYQKPPSPGLDIPTEYLSNANPGLPASPGPTVPPRQPRGGPPLAYENGRSLKRSGSRSRPASRAASPPVEHHTSTPISQAREPYASHSPPKHRLDRAGSHDVSKERLNRSLPEIEPETQRKDRGDSSDERYIARLKDDVDKLTEQVVKLRTEKMRMGDRLFEFLTQKTPNAWFDRDHQDPVAQILVYCEQLVKNAHENFLAADGLQLTLDTEKKKTEYLDQELDKATAEVQRLETELGKLQGYLKQSDRDLQDAGRVQASLEHERNQLRRQVTEKSRSLETQKKQYDSQISSLNQQVAGLMETVDGLKAQLSKQKNDLARQMQAQAQYYNETQRDMEARYEQTEAGYKEALQSEKEKAQQQLEEQKTLLEQESKKQLLMLEQEMKKKVQALEQQLQTERQGRDKELAKKDDQHARNVVHLRDKILSLEADLVDNVDDFRPATDDALKSKYREVKLLVETITEPFNLGVHTMPQSSRLDPTRLLTREGSKPMRFLLRSIVWARIIDGFFSAPFGFGAFGSGNGKQQLINVYYEWRKLFDFSQSAYRGGDEDYEQFRRDKEANKWRSATFQSIMTAVVPRGQKKALAATADKVRPYADNRQNVEEDILDILREVCNGAVSDEFQEKVTEIVRLAGELALEFGSQRAELGLDMPERGDSLEIGLEFVDCEDGDNARGKVEEVELVVAPKLFRVGDGRNDLKTRKTIFPGEIYPMQT